MPSGKKRKRHKVATHKRKKRRRANRHKKKKWFLNYFFCFKSVLEIVLFWCYFRIEQTINRSLKMRLQQPAFGFGAVSPDFI